MIRCSSCGKAKMASEFPRSDKSNPRGKRCRECRAKNRAAQKLQTTINDGHAHGYTAFASATNMAMDHSHMLNWRNADVTIRPKHDHTHRPKRKPAGGFV